MDNPSNLDIAKVQSGKCEECQQEECFVDGILMHYFDVQVCFHCKQSSSLKMYSLLSKTSAKQEFLLPDSSLDRLRHWAKPNPHNELFQPLKLYLKKQLVQEAERLYKSLEELERVKRSKATLQYEKAVKRTSHLLLSAETIRNQPRKRLKRTQALLSSRLLSKTTDSSSSKASNGQATNTDSLQTSSDEPQRAHQHLFSQEKQLASGTWTKKCSCGLRVEFEKF